MKTTTKKNENETIALQNDRFYKTGRFVNDRQIRPFVNDRGEKKPS